MTGNWVGNITVTGGTLEIIGDGMITGKASKSVITVGSASGGEPQVTLNGNVLLLAVREQRLRLRHRAGLPLFIQVLELIELVVLF